MSFWSRLKRVSATEPPRIIIYGPPGMGKTSLASEFETPIFLQIEDGAPSDIEIDTFGKINSYREVEDALAALYNDQHDFKTIVIDSADKLEPLVQAEVCAENKWDNIESPGYGKGYAVCDGKWRDLVGALNTLRSERGMTIVVICHSEVGRFDDPSSVSYSQYDLRLHKRAKAILCDEADAIFLLKQDVQTKSEDLGFNKTRAIGEGVNRFIFTEGRPAFIAKNRYGMPAKIKFDKGKGYAALSQYFPKQADNVAEDKAA